MCDSNISDTSVISMKKKICSLGADRANMEGSALRKDSYTWGCLSKGLNKLEEFIHLVGQESTVFPSKQKSICSGVEYFVNHNIP